MPGDQLGRQLRPGLRLDQRLPGRHLLVAGAGAPAGRACCRNPCRIGDEIGVTRQQMLHPGHQRRIDAYAVGAAQAFEERGTGHVQAADAPALGFVHTGRAGSTPRSTDHRRVSKAFCPGWGVLASPPSTDPRWMASPSRSSTCSPASASAPSSAVLALPVGPHSTRKENFSGNAQDRPAPAGEKPCSRLSSRRAAPAPVNE